MEAVAHAGADVVRRKRQPPTELKLSPADLDVLLHHAKQADSWMGSPPADVESYNLLRLHRHLVRLERLGLISLKETSRYVWVHFTPAGADLCAQHGVKVEPGVQLKPRE